MTLQQEMGFPCSKKIKASFASNINSTWIMPKTLTQVRRRLLTTHLP